MGKLDLLFGGEAMVAQMGAMKRGCDGHHNAGRGQLGGGVAVRGDDAVIEVVPEVAARPDRHAGDGTEVDVGEVIED